MKIVVCGCCAKIRNYDKHDFCGCGWNAYFNWQVIYDNRYRLVIGMLKQLRNK